jgi:chemotaxis protein histidine kinase CheA/ActR/RegA family two-component response regulator
VASEKIERLMAVSTDYVTAGHSLAAQAARFGELLGKLDTFMRRMPELRAKPELRELRRSVALLDEELAGTRRRYVQMTAELQDGVRQLRMLRIDAVRNVFARAVAEMARSVGKSAEFVTIGGDTEVDRAVLEGLRDPLVHLIRNAVAHGIEPEAERIAAGKPRSGTITLRAWSTRSSVVVELADDGRGIDTATIVQAAVAQRLVQPELAAKLGDDAARELLFAPGFSTLSRVGDLAGRGVGLDVVRRNLTQLGGSVRCDSRPGRGATFRVELPLTRLTTRAIHVRLGRHDFLVLAAQVVRTCLVTSDDLQLSDGQEVVIVDGNPLAVLRLEQAFGFRADGRDQRVAVVVGDGSRHKAVLVDELVGEMEVLVQPLGWNLKAVRGIAGAAVLEGHRVLPVLNAAELVSFAAGSRSAQGRGEGTRSNGQRKVLVVDDSITSRTLLKNILSSAGYAIETAIDGEDGWSKLTQGRFDVVVTDVEMPRLTGFELTRRIRSDAKMRGCTVVLCTSLGNDAEKRMGAEAGADAYIVKGAFDQDELLAALARLIPSVEQP